MPLLDKSSLANTVDAINAALFAGGQLSAAERAELAAFIAARQGQPRSYRGLFAPTDSDFAKPVILFTGEQLASRASTAHILGEEAYRVLLVLNVHTPAVDAALNRAGSEMGEVIRRSVPDKRGPGVFCCGRCSVALWRCLLAGGYGGGAGFLASGLETLSRARDGKGHWGIFPFWYTVLALHEMGGKAARAELRYAEPLLARAAKRSAGDSVHAQRRRLLAERALAKC